LIFSIIDAGMLCGVNLLAFKQAIFISASDNKHGFASGAEPARCDDSRKTDCLKWILAFPSEVIEVTTFNPSLNLAGFLY
jgi:hypothetical protein